MPARLGLTATLLRGADSRRFELDARLRVPGLPGAEGRRVVLLERLDGTGWSRVATAVTDAGGLAGWRYTLTPGTSRIRARYLGTEEIAPAVSSPVRLTVR